MSKNLWVDDNSSDDDAVWATANTKFQPKKQSKPEKIVDTSGGYRKPKRKTTQPQNSNSASNGVSQSVWKFQKSDSDDDLKGWGEKSSQNTQQTEQNSTSDSNSTFNTQNSSENPNSNFDTTAGYKKKQNIENNGQDSESTPDQHQNSNENESSTNNSHENRSYNRPGMFPPDPSQNTNQPPRFENQNIYHTGYPDGYLPSAQPVSENILDIQGEPEIEVQGWGKKWNPNDLGSDWKVFTNQFGGGAPPPRNKKPNFFRSGNSF